ncbi:hypothetical protein GCM10010358_05330 [Streptomyces minutiscleroticus]|uniref:HTH araC/xylS-type domain-containing protein n=1 Tax=Streptomyces minutiscleroticus TaxID=68238 RepID=A0A918NAS6_9ACTN|nr:helix-turn-helix domain-containing protein [Streptomyces minutiscleroticus]GGX54264.1 hypothetical protein GCM10010358_05330 [Streptomyces minutiscleroticus]
MVGPRVPGHHVAGDVSAGDGWSEGADGRRRTAAERAARHGMTTDRLRAAVRRDAGRTPEEYLPGIRPGRAEDLLATADPPVAAAARRAGYDAPARFPRPVTRRAATAPVRFRARRGRTVPGGRRHQVAGPGGPPAADGTPDP